MSLVIGVKPFQIKYGLALTKYIESIGTNMPIEVIFQEIRFKLDEAEEQIRFFIEAKQQKTMEIENEIKSNKK